jgi:hypothetical protein
MKAAALNLLFDSFAVEVRSGVDSFLFENKHGRQEDADDKASDKRREEKPLHATASMILASNNPTDA